MKPPGCPAHGRGDHSLLLKTKSGLGRPWVSGGLPVGTKLLRAPASRSAWWGAGWWGPPTRMLTAIAEPCVFIHLPHSIST